MDGTLGDPEQTSQQPNNGSPERPVSASPGRLRSVFDGFRRPGEPGSASDRDQPPPKRDTPTYASTVQTKKVPMSPTVRACLARCLEQRSSAQYGRAVTIALAALAAIVVRSSGDYLIPVTVVLLGAIAAYYAVRDQFVFPVESVKRDNQASTYAEATGTVRLLGRWPSAEVEGVAGSVDQRPERVPDGSRSEEATSHDRRPAPDGILASAWRFPTHSTGFAGLGPTRLAMDGLTLKIWEELPPGVLPRLAQLGHGTVAYASTSGLVLAVLDDDGRTIYQHWALDEPLAGTAVRRFLDERGDQTIRSAPLPAEVPVVEAAVAEVPLPPVGKQAVLHDPSTEPVPIASGQGLTTVAETVELPVTKAVRDMVVLSIGARQPSSFQTAKAIGNGLAMVATVLMYLFAGLILMVMWAYGGRSLEQFALIYYGVPTGIFIIYLVVKSRSTASQGQVANQDGVYGLRVDRDSPVYYRTSGPLRCQWAAAGARDLVIGERSFRIDDAVVATRANLDHLQWGTVDHTEHLVLEVRDAKGNVIYRSPRYRPD